MTRHARRSSKPTTAELWWDDETLKVAIPGNARPDLGGQQTKEITDPLYYNDGKVIHACESGIVVPGVRLVRTKCNRDVPDNASFTFGGGAIEVTCRKCREAAADADAASER
jgi:hypothetical protein